MNVRSFRYLSALKFVLLLSAPALVAGEELNLTARQLYEQGITHQLQLQEGVLQLTRGALVADDGPAAGFSYQPNVEKLNGDMQILKKLEIARPQAKEALLLIARGGEMTATINGQKAKLEFVRKQGNYWDTYRIDPKLLRAGMNEVVLSGKGEVWIARDDEFAQGAPEDARPANRSAKSTDGGQTWDYDHLGRGNDVDGEYCVRLHLDQYVATAELTTPVLDSGNLAAAFDRAVSLSGKAAQEVQVRLAAEVPSACQLELQSRSGATFQVTKEWSKWQTATDWQEAEVPLAGRFFQLRVIVKSRSGEQTPKIKGLDLVTTNTDKPAWANQLRVVGSDNTLWNQTCIDFRYEPFDHPRLERLREEYKLDDVVKGAQTELEIASRLAVWSAKRWPKIAHLKEGYPEWDALEILSLHADGTPVGGFCQQYNLVFLQACESFGIPGRAVSLGPGNRTDKIRSGHEVVEIWSNEFRKWIYVDGNFAWYAVDEPSGDPLSLWELRQRQLAKWAGQATFPPVKMVHLYPEKYEWGGFDQTPAFVELRIIPRSNFLEQKYPVPLNQGMRGWFWTGHWVWTDDLEPARPIYENFVSKLANFDWSLNQVRLAVEPGEPGFVRLHLTDNMPHREAYLVTLNDAEPIEIEGNTLTWKLDPGRNRLSVVGRNTAGRTGIPSALVLDYQPR